MKLYLVAAIRQMDDGTQYVIVRDRRAAEEWRREIQRDPAMVDGGHADYLVNFDASGRLSACEFPGKTLTLTECRAICTAIRESADAPLYLVTARTSRTSSGRLSATERAAPLTLDAEASRLLAARMAELNSLGE